MESQSLGEALPPPTQPPAVAELVGYAPTSEPRKQVPHHCEPTLAPISKARPHEVIFQPCSTAPTASHPIPATPVNLDSDGVVFKEAAAAVEIATILRQLLMMHGLICQASLAPLNGHASAKSN
ncbi:hypothetical protein GOP47_0008859 [Adiantum capillus-veneris]|uniref:Uncharacterized protein n=1 Tax=Adiantum capillus-veneris TaxID=13818 RepID=A0A9D4ZIJ8_ADICA|nr:hypothetical protein GOP47_0008859 [Adiantum capillus-veneris]